jgi:hypothetical protein
VEDTIKSIKYLTKDSLSTIEMGLINMTDDDPQSLCRNLFSTKLKTYGTIVGAYLDVLDREKRCGYILDRNASSGYTYMESNSRSGITSLAYYAISDDFVAINNQGRSLSYDPRNSSWYSHTIHHGGMYWSSPYIHPLSNKAIITLSSTISNRNRDGDDRNEIMGLISFDVELRGNNEFFQSNELGEEFIVEKGTHILISSSSSGMHDQVT